MIDPPRPMSCHRCPRLERSEWAALPVEDVALLDRAKVQHRFRPGQMLFHQGGRCIGLHCVASGTVALRRSDADGRSVIVRLVRGFEPLGHEALFCSGTHPLSAEALTAVDVCFLDRTLVDDLVARHPPLVRAFLHRVALDLRDADDEKLRLVTRSVRDRLLLLLATFADRDGTDGGGGTLEVELPLSRQDVAALLGVRPESVARAVRTLEDEGVARFEGRAVRILDVEALLGADGRCHAVRPRPCAGS